MNPRSTAFPRRMLAALAVAGLALLAAPAPAHAAEVSADAVTGKWLTEPGDKGGRARVEVRKEGSRYVGRIVWLEEPNFEDGPHKGQAKMDLENPDNSLRERPIIGLAILSGMTYEGDGTWGGGTIYDPANGKTYKAKMSLDSNGDATLDVRGFIGVSLFGRTTTWKRVE